jgi:hypothetical protein
MFQVFDNEKPADCEHHNVNKSWSCSIFSSFKEARVYAKNWLGGSFEELAPKKPNVKINYSGYGDTIEIREVSHPLCPKCRSRDSCNTATLDRYHDYDFSRCKMFEE